MNPDYVKLRIALLFMAIMGVLFSVAAMYMSRFRDPIATVITMIACFAYILFRGMNGQDRRMARKCYMDYHGTHMQFTDPIKLHIRAGFAWAMCDAIWISADFTTCLTWGIPGVLVAIFQTLFLAGFPAAEKIKPDLFDSQEKIQAMDLTESMMYGVACVVICAMALIYTRTTTGGA